jgi:hypothetical protein
MAANSLVGHCQMTKKIEVFVNKLFKMSDGFLTEHLKMPTTGDRLNRNMINLTFEAFRKKKEAFA